MEPVGPVFNEDNYYLMAYSARHNNTANYRVDRMDAVEIISEDICDKALEFRQSVAGYTEQAFKMYGGPPMQITLQFSNKLIGAVYDRFGEGTKMIPIGDDECAATVLVQISPTFQGWLSQFGKQMTVLSPEGVINEYKQRLHELTDTEE